MDEIVKDLVEYDLSVLFQSGDRKIANEFKNRTGKDNATVEEYLKALRHHYANEKTMFSLCQRFNRLSKRR